MHLHAEKDICTKLGRKGFMGKELVSIRQWDQPGNKMSSRVGWPHDILLCPLYSTHRDMQRGVFDGVRELGNRSRVNVLFGIWISGL